MWKANTHFALAAALLAALAVAVRAQEAPLIGVLKSGASQAEKAAACRQLARVATKDAVPALAALLGDEKLSHMARYALETIPDKSVDAALRDALNKVQGRPLLGVIGSLGMRRDAQAVDALARLLGSPDGETAQSAARALGNIGTAEAAQALQKALEKAPAGESAASRLAVCEGLLRCAESRWAHGDAVRWRAIYDGLRGLPNAPPQVRAAALRGAILGGGTNGIPLMLQALRGTDGALTAAAVRAALELPGPQVTTALSDELPKLPAGKQILVVNTLGQRGDPLAGPALLALASRGPDAIRLAAVQNVTRLAYAPALPLLVELSLADETDLTAAARTCLGSFPGKAGDATIVAMLGHKDAKVRSLAVEFIGQRSVDGATASLVKAADDADESVRLAAIKALLPRAGAAELPALLTILVKARSSAESQLAERAVKALCARQSRPASGNVVVVKAVYGDLSAGISANVTKKVAALIKSGELAIEASNENFGDPASHHVKKLRVDYRVNGVSASKTVAENETLTLTATSTPPEIVDAICAALPAAHGEARLALLRTLRSAGGPKALQTLTTALADADPNAKATAIATLCNWPSPDALPAITELAKNPPSPTVKLLALEGLVRLVPQMEAADAKKADVLKSALALADRNEEKKLILSAVGSVPAADCLALAASLMENPALREEACLAAVAVAEKLGPQHRAQVTAAMKQVASLTANKNLAAQAGAVLRRAGKESP